MAKLTFSSQESYEIARIGAIQKIKSGMILYVSGFPLPTPAVPTRIWRFLKGEVIANATVDIPNGYQLLYSNPTLPGMSGGAVLNSQGELIGIHGQGETDTKMSEQQGIAVKTGSNQAVPITFYERHTSQRALTSRSKTEKSTIPPDIGRPNSRTGKDLALSESANIYSIENIRRSAIGILDAVKRGDAYTRFAQFSPQLQALTSPSSIEAAMRTQPQVLEYRLISVGIGINGSTVEAELSTKAGKRVAFMVLNSTGKIERYYIDRANDPSSSLAFQFVQAMSTGNFIMAQRLLSPSLQREIRAEDLQTSWIRLENETGKLVTVGRAVEAESARDSRLVLVKVASDTLTENLYVILNSKNEITGIEFPGKP
jgi:hypothetical protein